MTPRAAAAIFFAVGLPALAFGLWSTVRTLAGQAGQPRIEGRVVDFERGTMRTGGPSTSSVPIVEFDLPDGRTVRFTAAAETGNPVFVGDEVTVRYDPADPEDATIDEFWNNWLLPILGLGFGLFFTLGGWGVATGRVEMARR